MKVKVAQVSPFYEGGLGVNGWPGTEPLTAIASGSGGEQRSSFYRLLLREDKANWRFTPAVQLT
jgi:hypothetical protein